MLTNRVGLVDREFGQGWSWWRWKKWWNLSSGRSAGDAWIGERAIWEYLLKIEFDVGKNKWCT